MYGMFNYISLICIANVEKYASPMDPMGNGHPRFWSQVSSWPQLQRMMLARFRCSHYGRSPNHHSHHPTADCYSFNSVLVRSFVPRYNNKASFWFIYSGSCRIIKVYLMYILYSLIFVTTQSDHVDVDKEYIYIYIYMASTYCFYQIKGSFLHLAHIRPTKRNWNLTQLR